MHLRRIAISDKRRHFVMKVIESINKQATVYTQHAKLLVQSDDHRDGLNGLRGDEGVPV